MSRSGNRQEAGKKKSCAPCPSSAGVEAGESDTTASPKKCCVEAALSGEACGELTAEQVKEAVAGCPHAQAVRNEMRACCVEALEEGEGCCGRGGEVLRAGFVRKVMALQAAEPAGVGKGSCCAAVAPAGNGHGSKEAETRKADWKKKAKSEEKKLAGK